MTDGPKEKLDRLKGFIIQLTPDETTMQTAALHIENCPFFPAGKQAEFAELLKNEWVADILARPHEDLPTGEQIISSQFLKWLRKRIENPYEVSIFTKKKIIKVYGEEQAVPLIEMVWPQQIAWARRYRSDPDDDLVLAAAMLLREALEAPGKFMETIVEVHASNLFENRRRTLSKENRASPTMIWPAVTEFDMQHLPACMIYATDRYAERISKLNANPDRARAAAQKVRETDQKERFVTIGGAKAEAYTVNAFYRLPDIIRLAVSRNFTSNELVMAYFDFVLGLKNGDLPLVSEVFSSPIEAAMFARYIMRITSSSRDEPTPEQIQKRRLDIDALGLPFIEKLPGYYDGKSKDARNFREWKAAIADGRREVPRDPAADYCHFLESLMSQMMLDHV